MSVNHTRKSLFMRLCCAALAPFGSPPRRRPRRGQPQTWTRAPVSFGHPSNWLRCGDDGGGRRGCEVHTGPPRGWGPGPPPALTDTHGVGAPTPLCVSVRADTARRHRCSCRSSSGSRRLFARGAVRATRWRPPCRPRPPRGRRSHAPADPRARCCATHARRGRHPPARCRGGGVCPSWPPRRAALGVRPRRAGGPWHRPAGVMGAAAGGRRRRGLPLWLPSGGGTHPSGGGGGGMGRGGDRAAGRARPRWGWRWGWRRPV